MKRISKEARPPTLWLSAEDWEMHGWLERKLGGPVTTFPLTWEEHPCKLKFRTMRVLKAIYLSVLFTLAMGLFCGELPESMRLQDDTSNDFVADSSASAARESEAARDNDQKPAKTPQVVAAKSAPSNGIEDSSISVGHSRYSGKELLPLLSIRRT